MLITIEDINFPQAHIHMRISGNIEHRHIRRLNALFSRCQSLHLKNIVLQLPYDISEQSSAVLSEVISCSNALIRIENHPAGPCRTSVKASSVFTHRFPGPSSDAHEYHYTTSTIKTASENIQSVISILSEAMDLDDKSYYRLKLCVYELTANSVEHGVFKTGSPSISISIRFNRDSLFVCYRDNAEEFILNAFHNLDIKEKIKDKNTRGYGLFIMNCLTSDLQFTRVKNVNQTTFKIMRPALEAGSKQGRTTMEQFSIKLVSCDIDNAMIVKPIGSIDSMTTQNVEEQLFSLMEKKTKYIIIDFSEVNFISSAGIGILLGTVSTLREDGGDLMLMKIPAQIEEIFDILNISNYFIAVDSIGELKETIHSKA